MSEAASPQYDRIPDELKARDQWLMWGSTDPDAPRQPHWRGDYSISWSDPEDWHTFEEAVAAASEREAWGIGYVMALDNDAHARGLYGCLDIDGALQDDDSPTDWLPGLDRFIEADAYIERSPSGTGLHIPFVGYDPPEWWTDCQLGDHEGVDVLTNKFCTFTGDTIGPSGDRVYEDDPTEWLYKAYEAINGESPRLEPSEDATGHSYDNDEWLDEDAVQEALDHISADVEYPTWRDIGFAIHDWDSGPTGRSLFEDWSRGGSKYDDDADRYIDAIWENASQGDGVTVATLVHHAKQNGWSPSSGPDSPRPQTNDVDESEVDRAEVILEEQTSPTNPAGELEHSAEHGYGYNVQHEGKDGETYYTFETVANFTLETVEYLEIDGQDDPLMTVKVHPVREIDNSYEVQIFPTVFNEPRKFREQVVRGRTTKFEAHQKPAQQVLNELRVTVGSQPAPVRAGTEFIGLAGEDYDEFVTPEGTLTAEGWAEDPNHRHYLKTGDRAQSSALGQKWQLGRDDGSDYDESVVREICELLPNTRPYDRGLPILGWFYAAPLKPLIHDWEGEFNLLEVYGDTGSGKTSTIQTYWQAFGVDPDPFSASDTAFTVEKHMAESCGLPVWYDEYKPADIEDYRLKRLHRRFREVTRERVVSKGQQDLSEVTLKLRAPVVFSGEQQIDEVAVRRRTIMTNVRQAATADGTGTMAAFGELTGTPYEDADGEQHDPDGYDLREHAMAFYRYVLATEPATFRELWLEAREQVSDLLDQLDIGSVENTERQGLQTIIFGTEVFRAFAKAVGADESELPTGADLRDAVAHVAANIGYDGRRREHTDEFVEVLAQAATEGYINEGEHYRVIDSRTYGDEVLAFHMPSSFNAVKKFLREYNLEDEITSLGRQDYVDSFGNKADTDGSYVLETNKRTRGLANGSKAVYIDPERSSEKLGEAFYLGAFKPEGTEDQEEAVAGATPIASLGDERGYVTLTAAIATLESATDADDDYNGPVYSGVLRDATGVVDWVDFRGLDGLENVEEDDTLLLRDVRVGEYDGAPQVEVVPGVSEVESADPGVGHLPDASSGKNHDLETAADGGKEKIGTGRVHEHLQTHYESGEELTAAAIAGELTMDPEKVDHALDKLAQKGEVAPQAGGGYERT